ncbi:MAG: ABC transporter ATP-binding protein [Candidatus Wallbacteria bacterium]|nr:ABC transporter ATP-binding protein [Candidatus Wallbacteria bacterium]
MSTLELRALGRSYGTHAVVTGFDQKIASGEFVSFLGPSGCGKTTTLRMIAGLDEPTSGEVEIGGRLVSAPARGVFVAPEERRLGMVFQSYALWPHMTVGENVGYPLKLRGVSRQERDAAAARMLELVHLGGLGGRQPHQLSGGQQQRVALARALVMEPEVLLLDEPLSNLDAQLREELRFEIKDLQRRLGVTVVFVTHDQSEAMAMSDRIIVMREGRIRQVGPPAELYDHPADLFVAGFLGLANVLEGVVESSGSESCRVRLSGLAGQPVVDCRGTVATGSRADIVIRPEHFEVAPGETTGLVSGKVTRVTFLGDRVDCRVASGGAELRLALAAGSAPCLGDTLALRARDAVAFAQGPRNG